MKETPSLPGKSPDSSDTERFLRLFMASDKRIYAYIFTLVPNRVDADDLMQETTSVLWRKFDEFEPGRDFVAWAIGIARYEVLKFRNNNIKSRIKFSDKVVELIESDTKNLLKNVDIRLEALRHCLGKLSKFDRRLVDMRYDENYTIKNIAEQFGKSIHSVYKAMVRINGLLLRCIRRTMFEQGVT